MNITIKVHPDPIPFVDLTEQSEARIGKITRYLGEFSRVFSETPCASYPFDKSKVIVTLPLAFLWNLVHSPQRALSFREESILKLSKSYEKKTNFYLNTPGAVILMLPALAGGVAAALGFYYGVNQTTIDPVKMAVIFGVATFISGYVSNMLGFYITGTLPDKKSDADNAEQNMWDDFARLKTKPAAYQLIQWFSPKTLLGETLEQKTARRQLARAFFQHLDLPKIIGFFKTLSTQQEKVDIAFRDLYDAKEIIEEQMSLEASPGIETTPVLWKGDLHAACSSLGYGTKPL